MYASIYTISRSVTSVSECEDVVKHGPYNENGNNPTIIAFKSDRTHFCQSDNSARHTVHGNMEQTFNNNKMVCTLNEANIYINKHTMQYDKCFTRCLAWNFSLNL